MAHCLLTIGLLLCQTQLLSRVTTDLLDLKSSSPVTLLPSRTQVKVPHTLVEQGAVVTTPAQGPLGSMAWGCAVRLQHMLPLGTLHLLSQNVPLVPLFSF